jgi:hypothetical protein
VYGLGPEARAARGGAHQPGGLREIEVEQLAARGADGVIVAGGLAVVAARGVAEGDLAQQALALQVAQRVVDGREADRGQPLPRRGENLRRRRVPVALFDDFEDDPPLPRQPAAAPL